MKRLVNGQEVELEASSAKVRTVGDRLFVTTEGGTHSALAVKHGDKTYVSYLGQQFIIEPIRASRHSGGKDHSGDLISPMPGVVVEVLVVEGQAVKKGDKVIILEAMKTQQAFVAPFDGKIAKLVVSKGEQVSDGLVMAIVEQAEE
ncbi:MAG: biotin/lipoyl-binding protein [Chlorobia bacterium]|nr:biotin/lipoyl-binding protein [Fimbriimonadaceae bacterium]